MASSKEYLTFVLEQLSGLEEVSCRGMMGEYILYVQGKAVGGIYDNRLLIKPTQAAERMMPAAPRARPYPGARELLVVEEADDSAFLQDLLRAVSQELPPSRPKKKTAASAE